VSANRDKEQLRRLEGHMNPLRIFIVLSWVTFALRQIMLKPARVVAGLGGEASDRAPPAR
jgi:hypothetical protein